MHPYKASAIAYASKRVIPVDLWYFIVKITVMNMQVLKISPYNAPNYLPLGTQSYFLSVKPIWVLFKFGGHKIAMPGQSSFGKVEYVSPKSVSKQPPKAPNSYDKMIWIA